jgi:two-component system, NarL family, invasion response regulator UvrY
MARVLIADDHAVVREGLKRILAEELGVSIFGEASTSQEVIQRMGERDWDIVILDITMPGRSGLDALKELRQSHPRVPVLVLSMHPEDQFAIRVLKAGAAGYLTKERAPEELISAVRRVLAGGKYVSASLAERLAGEVARDTEKLPHEALSDREYQILRLIASGKTVSEIAQILVLSVKTISTYRVRILQKMNKRTNAELTTYAERHGLVE